MSQCPHDQNKAPQNCIWISDVAQAHEVGAPYVDQDRQGCSRQEGQLSTSPALDQPVQHRAGKPRLSRC